ncbi:hypothetical protein N177_2505 [Lutibaculum baratangense AMV1]|uniref:Uncharacterized protein n=1 Tax=Lutibaculum baratangense AMV1 TaxID=631454 RepID=V4RD30_9HYPH|nr:hypothetical protein N177_2505 [Lutibaculum baratangense AMV1]
MPSHAECERAPGALFLWWSSLATSYGTTMGRNLDVAQLRNPFNPNGILSGHVRRAIGCRRATFYRLPPRREAAPFRCMKEMRAAHDAMTPGH